MAADLGPNCAICKRPRDEHIFEARVDGLRNWCPVGDTAFDPGVRFPIQQLMGQVLMWAEAALRHEKHQSEPARNVSTGQNLYALEMGLRKVALETMMDFGPDFQTAFRRAMEAAVEYGESVSKKS